MPDLATLSAWAGARRAMRMDADRLTRRRAGLWEGLRPALARTPALARLAGGPLRDYPVVTAAEVRADYGRWNSLGLSDAAVRSAAADAEAGGRGEASPGVVAGLSTGTAGERGVFLAGPAERAAYVGQSVARLLPASAPLAGARVALFLRAGSALYGDVTRAGRFRFRHFPLGMPGVEAAEALRAFAPDVLVAPPHVLAGLARSGVRLPLRRCLYGSEPMGEGERAWVGGRLGARPDPVYQATEGFLAAACRHGRLHLNDDTLVVELLPVTGTPAFRPVVTDLLRTSQPVVRVALDDLLEPDPSPCPCGFAGRVVRPVCGRVGDAWHLGGRVILPREVTEAAEAAFGPDADWAAEGSATGVSLSLAHPVADAVRVFADALGLGVPVRSTGAAPGRPGPKRRRVSWVACHG